jgi:D-alanyl-D-alanine carboxypeptidase
MPKRFAPAVLMFMTGASPALSVPGAPPPVAQTMAAQHLPASGMSFAIIDPDTGRLIAGQNLDTPRSPASTIKVVTTFASLDLLGPAYVWHTRAAIRGEIHNGVLDGDLVLQGGGDPYMTLERWWRFARTLRDNGLKDHPGRHRHRQHGVLAACGGSGSLRWTAEPLLQRPAGRVDGQFPIHRVQNGAE